MNIPNLPTDSLYKFISILGLLFILLYNYIEYNRLIEFSKLRIEILTNIDSIKFEVEHNKKYHKGEFVHSKDASEILRTMQDVSVKSKEMEYLEDEHEIIKNKINWLLYFGIVLMVVGVFFWYIKIQIHQDKLIKKSIN